MTLLTIPSRERALYLSREVPLAEAAIGMTLTATTGQTKRRLTSLAMVEAFMQPLDEIAVGDIHAHVTYVNPVGLAGWISETIGDTELGEELAAIAEDGRAYGYQIHDIKPLLATRLAQYAEAIGEVASTI